jgi:thiamine phosphate synthase YjbQ (UPF0047 family)
LRHVARATTGGLVDPWRDFVIDTDERLELVDLTDRVMEFVRKFDIREGMITLWSMHTTCSRVHQRVPDRAAHRHPRFLEEMVARDSYYQHNDPDHSDCDRMNADSHLRAHAARAIR